MEDINKRLFPNLEFSKSEPEVGETFTISQNNLHYFIDNVDKDGIAYKRLMDDNWKTNEVTKLEGEYYIVSSALIN